MPEGQLGLAGPWQLRKDHLMPDVSIVDHVLLGVASKVVICRKSESVALFEMNLIDGVPFGILGRIAHAVYVKKKVESIFTFREARLKELFPA